MQHNLDWTEQLCLLGAANLFAVKAIWQSADALLVSSRDTMSLLCFWDFCQADIA